MCRVVGCFPLRDAAPVLGTDSGPSVSANSSFPDGVCFDTQIAGGVKFSCSADGTTYDYEVYGADPNCQGAGDAGVDWPPPSGHDGSIFAIPTPGCYLTADPTDSGQWYNSAECFGPDYNSDMTCGAPASTVDAGQTTSSRRSRVLFAVVVAIVYRLI